MSNHTDRELLELAAEAAGYDYECVSHTGNAEHDQHQVRAETGNLVDWNPLTDDGDALRLAVKLCLDINFYPGDEVEVVRETQGVSCEPFNRGDDSSSTRRAIVRSAAAMGEMKRQEQE